MMNATEEKKAEKGLGNARFMEGGGHSFKKNGQRRPHGEDDTQADVKMPYRR